MSGDLCSHGSLLDDDMFLDPVFVVVVNPFCLWGPLRSYPLSLRPAPPTTLVTTFIDASKAVLLSS